jgi:hypothetical protein
MQKHCKRWIIFIIKNFSFRIFDVRVIHYLFILYYVILFIQKWYMLGIFKYLCVFFYFTWFSSNSELKNIACLEIIQRKSFSMRPVLTNLFLVNYIGPLTTIKYMTKINATDKIRNCNVTMPSVLSLLPSSHSYTYVDVARKNNLLFYYDVSLSWIRLTYKRSLLAR